ncbi:YggT family protein [Cellvibrio sp. KY-GH-1]|uniref:YggT family protein n=1 Tax=Cellvibrio sp. KY-GH-1 TaxID=2303332 RepID=UPI001248AE8D|nr:YggT family protein [Cellvibrio sp. KY-GH-1]QEY17424.1 YggT family protein [Cellvibrio sp. KY-GH-1]
MIANILHLIVSSLMLLFLVIVVLRFLLQLVRADFYNPVSQGIVKVTMPLLKPLRKIIPGFLGIDMASVVLILLVQFLASAILSVVVGQTGLIANPFLLIAWGFVGALTIMSSIFFWCMIISIIGSFVAPFSHHPLLTLANQIINPLAAPIRKVLPPLGGVIDVSPIIILLGLKIVDMLIIRFAMFLGVNPLVTLGNW